MSRDGQITRARELLSAAGISLRQALEPEQDAAILAVPGIGRKMLGILREQAALDEGHEQPRGPGRPATVGGRPVMVMLDPESLDRARALGNGNVSAGIRLALRNKNEAV